MNGVDYSKSLARERDNYLQKLQEKDRATNAQVKNVEETAENNRASQKRAYENSLEKTERNFQDRVETLSNDQRDAIANKTNEFNKQAEAEKNRFAEERRSIQKNFADRYDNLKTEYGEKFDEQDRLGQLKSEQDKNNYSTRLTSIDKANKDKLDEINESASGGAKALREKFAKDKKELVNRHDTEMIKKQKEDTEARNLFRDQVVKSVDKIRTESESDRMKNRDMSRDRFEQVQGDANNRIKTTQDNAETRKNLMIEEQKKEIQKQNKMFNERYSAQEKFMNDSLRELELKDKRSGDTAGSLRHNLAAKDQMLRDDATRDRIDKVINERRDMQSNFDQKYNDAIDKFQDNYRNTSIDNANNLEKLERTYAEKNFEDATNDRITRDVASRQYDSGLKSMVAVNESKQKDQEEKTSKQLSNLKENFNKALTDVQEKNVNSFEQVKKEAQEEKNKIMLELSRQNTNDKYDMKKQFLSKIDTLSQVYEKKIQGLETANIDLKTRFEDTVREITYKSNKEIERINDMHSKNQAIAVETERRIGDQKVSDLKNSMVRMEGQFNEKMIVEKRMNEKQLREYQIRSNEQIELIKKKYEEQMAELDRGHIRDKERMKNEFDFEKKNIVTQYQDQIQNFKDREVQRVSDMKEFAKSLQAGSTSKA
jgi:hypothetical protein